MARDQSKQLGDDEKITASLIMVSQLRALFSRLPHLGTPRERAELEEFRGYRQAAGPLAKVRIPPVRTGFREAWRTGDFETILDVGQRIPEAVLRADPDIQTYYGMARLRLARPQAHPKSSESQER